MAVRANLLIYVWRSIMAMQSAVRGQPEKYKGEEKKNWLAPGCCWWARLIEKKQCWCWMVLLRGHSYHCWTPPLHSFRWSCSVFLCLFLLVCVCLMLGLLHLPSYCSARRDKPRWCCALWPAVVSLPVCASFVTVCILRPNQRRLNHARAHTHTHTHIHTHTEQLEGDGGQQSICATEYLEIKICK